MSAVNTSSNTWILHLDGDGFFAACEIALDPKLKEGKPVVTGQERGIATAMSPEAKRLGITRGMPIYQVKKLYPEAVVVSSNYRSYSIFAHRMYNIVRRYSDFVEEYSIDECFADLSALPDPVAVAKEIKASLKRELGITFSVGLAPTKVLAKVASKWNKPDGFTVINQGEIRGFIEDLAVGKVWGIGPATSIALNKLGITTALELVERPLNWVEENLSKPHVALWHELQGEPAKQVHYEPDDDYGSIQKTRTFSPPSTNKSFVWSELSKNIESACAKARGLEFASKRVYIFLKTQAFRYHRLELPLAQPTNDPSIILDCLRGPFERLYKRGVEYRATGATLAELRPLESLQNDLFGEVVKKSKSEIFDAIDELDRRYGSHTVVLASSLSAFKRRGKPERLLHLPCMGEVA